MPSSGHHHFAWKCKGKHKDLDAAYRQLQNYRDRLEDPPLMVVCNMDRIVIRTNCTNRPGQRYTIDLDNLKSPDNPERVMGAAVLVVG